MTRLLILAAATAAILPAVPAAACPPPPPGWVPPTEEQRLESFVTQANDIVYGVITHSGSTTEPARLKVHHVYRGAHRKGETIEAVSSWEHPVPVCAGMMTPPPPKPVGTYGVVVVDKSHGVLNFIKPADVQLMIARGWIKSARAR